MREILFKGKTTPKEVGEFNEVWVEGDLITSNGKHYIHPKNNAVSVSGELGKIIVMHEVIPDTICQYTGLTDKNGRKIFEGDIVTTKYELGRGGFYTFEVYYNKNLCQFALTINTGSYTKNKQYDWLQLTASKAKKIEVIGNVFDNPELLEKAR